MTPPGATQAGQKGRAGAPRPAVSLCPVETLKNRPDFLAANKGLRQGTPAFLLQARKRQPGDGAPGVVRVGFTCSKKVGNAVARNRAKRRLRALAQAVLPIEGQPGWDYVLIGRANITASRASKDMQSDLSAALSRIHRPK